MTAGPNLDYVAAGAAAQLTKTLLGEDKGHGHTCKPPRKGAAGEVTAQDSDNLVTKALGVIAESGVFACGLFLLSKSGNKVGWTELKGDEVAACCTISSLLLLAESPSWKVVQPAWTGAKLDAERINERKRAIIAHLVKISSLGLPELLLIRQVWEQTLTYARYMMRSLREKD